MKVIKAERIMHRGEKRVALLFPYDKDLISYTRDLPDARWSAENKFWHISDSEDFIEVLLEKFRGKAFIDYSSLKPTLQQKSGTLVHAELSSITVKENKKMFEEFPPLSEKGKSDITRYRRWMEALRYPPSTINTYSSMMVRFLRFVMPKEADECTNEDLYRIINDYILPNGLSFSF